MAEQLKAIAYQDQNSEQRATIKTMNSDWDEAPVVKNFHGHWSEWIKWWEGDQYLVYNPNSGKIEDITPYVERDVANVYNRMTPIIRQLWGQLRYKHEFYTEPNSTEREDILAAEIGSKSLDFTNYAPKWNFRGKINLAKLWALVVGNVYWKEWYDKEMWSYTATSDKKMKKIKGDINFDIVNPFNLRTDPQSKCGRPGWRWAMEGQRVPLAAIAEEFGIEERDLKNATTDSKDSKMFERNNLERSDEAMVIRKERYEIPSTDYPEGRMIVSAGQFLGYDDKNPNPDAQIGYFHLKGMLPILDEQYGDSMVRLMQDSQRHFNRLCSMVDEHLQEFRIKGMIPFGSVRPGDEQAYRRAGVDWVTYNPRAGTPYLQRPPEIPETHMNWIGRQENEMKEQSSVRDVSMGQLPKYASRASGKLWEGLKQQDIDVILPMIEDWDRVMEDIMSFRLQLIQEHWKPKRMVKIMGRKGTETAVKYFTGADIRGNTDVRVKPGVDVLTNRMVKQEAVGMMIEKGMIETPKDAFELMGLESSLEEYYEEQFVDKRQATRHLERMKEDGEEVPGHTEDDHEEHYQVFNNFRKSQEFEELERKRQELIINRMEFHMEQIGLQAGGGGAGEPPTEETAPEEILGTRPGIAGMPPERVTPETGGR